MTARQLVFFSKSVKIAIKRGLEVLRARSGQASHALRVCEARGKTPSLPSLVFRCQPRSRPFVWLLRVFEYAKIRTVLQSTSNYLRFKLYYMKFASSQSKKIFVKDTLWIKEKTVYRDFGIEKKISVKPSFGDKQKKKYSSFVLTISQIKFWN